MMRQRSQFNEIRLFYPPPGSPSSGLKDPSDAAPTAKITGHTSFSPFRGATILFPPDAILACSPSSAIAEYRPVGMGQRFKRQGHFADLQLQEIRGDAGFRF
jgi:hypothetical protein